MSQLSNPPDSQALLQSMLERLKLQPGRERHAYEHTGEPLPHASTLGTDGVGSVPNHKKERDDLTNGHVFSLSAKRFGVSSGDTNFTSKYGERLQAVHGFEQHRGPFFFPPQRDNSQMDGNTVSENVTLPRLSNASTGQDFLSKTFHSFGRTDTGEQRDNISGYKDQDHGFQHNVHDWSWGSTDFAADSQGNKSFHTENGGFGDLSKWRNMEMIPYKDISMTKRKQRSSENKARRWTQKLKERWMERTGKKGKDESMEGGMNKTLAQSRHINISHQDTKWTLPSPDSGENPTAQSEDDMIDAFIRSSDDFQFGFSSVSLLEEIVSGQEWAKFLSLAPSASSINQKTQEKKLSSPSVTPKPNHNGPSTFALHQSGGLNREWSFRSCESFPVYNIPVSVNLPEVPTQNNTEHRVANQSEPMEQGQIQSHVQLRESGLVQPRTSSVERADILDDSPPTSRVNRKRQHHSAEMSLMGWSRERQGEALPNSHAMADADEQNSAPFFSPNGSSAPHVPSNLTPCGPVPRGVLRHSTSQNSDSSWESKRRRVEPNRRVHFAETVQEIPPVLVDLDTWDSEEEYGTELGSGLEEEEEEACTTAEEEKEASARRPALPAWIRALKRKNTGRKHR
ncbi:uncharacterized protein zgc:113229 [Phycodurus eques]|uniref:uncharacterized protein zgc:113229 n=1 Tax=Phycodurus eques TaxID=693459 RepID=UPI002ACD6954|nr:uncharacterized protein zgc:113229 [Phycodurus eques]